MADSDAHIPTLGAARSPIRYFGDDYLEHDDFFARLPLSITVRLAKRGLNAPDPILAPYIFDAPFYQVFLPVIQEAFVNELLNKSTKEQGEIIKSKLKSGKTKWTFTDDKMAETITPTMYS